MQRAHNCNSVCLCQLCFLRPDLQWLLWLLRQQNAEALLDGDPLTGELVIRRKTRCGEKGNNSETKSIIVKCVSSMQHHSWQCIAAIGHAPGCAECVGEPSGAVFCKQRIQPTQSYFS